MATVFDFSLYLSIFPVFWFWNVFFTFLGTLASNHGGGSSEEDMDVGGEVNQLFTVSFAKGFAPGEKKDIRGLLESAELAVARKAVFWHALVGNTEGTEAELDILLRKAFAKTSRVQYDDDWYWVANQTALIDIKAGVQFRHVGLDFVMFGNAYETAPFILGGMSDPRAFTFNPPKDSTLEDIKRVVRAFRKDGKIDWAAACALTADQAVAGKHIMLIPTTARTPPKEIKVKFTRSTGGAEETVTLELVNTCDLCCGIGHELAACPKLASINKIREHSGYEPIKVVGDDPIRNDQKSVKSLETRMDGVEKAVAGLKSEFGQIKNRVDGLIGANTKKRKADNDGEGSKKKKAKKGKDDEKEAGPSKKPDEKSGDKPKKKFRGKRGGKDKGKEGEVVPSKTNE